MQLGRTVHLSGAEFFHNTEFVLGVWDSRTLWMPSEPVQNADNSHSTNLHAPAFLYAFHRDLPCVTERQWAHYNTCPVQCLFFSQWCLCLNSRGNKLKYECRFPGKEFSIRKISNAVLTDPNKHEGCFIADEALLKKRVLKLHSSWQHHLE